MLPTSVGSMQSGAALLQRRAGVGFGGRHRGQGAHAGLRPLLQAAGLQARSGEAAMSLAASGVAAAAAALLLAGGSAALAGDVAPEYLQPCRAADLACVSTSAISAPSKYLPPWSYDGAEDQAMRRLQEAVLQQGGRINAKQDRYLRVEIPYQGGFLRQSGVDTVEFLFNADRKLVTFRSVDSVAKAPPPFCTKPGCVNGPPNRQRMEALRDELLWSPLETDEDKKWVQIMLH
mmetsp:Transcript_16804/g.42135  ORF Transcript_16804/g.42135 Transcript_16804/m.42135 type:complete len:233 (+) Transcript_16804:300-998(+)